MTTRVDICLPAYGKVDAETVFSIFGLTRKANDLIGQMWGQKLMYIDQARNKLVQDVLADGRASHFLWLDSDMTWDKELVQRLLAHKKPVVGATYFLKMPPYDIVAGQFLEDQTRYLRLDHLPEGIEKVDVLGMGATLI